MNIAGLKESKFLTKADVGKGMLVTIREVFQENIAKTGAPEELKWCIAFDESEKPMVLNSTNGQIIASITKSEETDNWTGAKVVLYDDPNVSFGGKLVGGIRVRAPRGQAAQGASKPQTRSAAAPWTKSAPPPPPPEEYVPAEPEEDDIPF